MGRIKISKELQAKIDEQHPELKNLKKKLFKDLIIKDRVKAYTPNDKLRTLRLVLLGEPMPKQSVRATKSGHFFQPQKTVDRKKDYISQVKRQLPRDFVMFEHEVHLTKFHCVFTPLKGFQKIKGRMEAIGNGEIFYKNTKPDLIDNLKKLVFDSLSGLVTRDDCIIVTENDTAKYYGLSGYVEIELKGY